MISYYQFIPTDLVDYVETQIIPRYDEFDSAHHSDHARIVINGSLPLAAVRHLSIPMAYTIAAYHDLGLSVGRKFHHIDSGKILLADRKLLQWFSPEEITIMKEAVEDHRASSGKEPRSIYGKIVAEADRSIQPERTLTRIIQYGLDNYPEFSEEEQYTRFVNHLMEKYSPEGYVRLWLPDSPNAEPLKRLHAIIADRANLPSIFHHIYANLTTHK